MKKWIIKYQLYLGLVILALIAAGAAYWYIDSTLDVPVPPVGVNPDEGEQTSDIVQPELPPEQEPEQARLRCPIDGEVLTELPATRPLAVMIDNLTEARPPVGISDADIVYEALVEGGITRLMAVFYHGKAEQVGPIRSARPYFAQLAQDTKSVYVHAGWSPQAEDLIVLKKLPHLNEIPITRGFWRDKNRSQPHNLFSSTENLHELAADYNYEIALEVPGFDFYSEQPEAPENVRLSDEIIIYYPQQHSQVRYRYDEETNDYRRFMGGKAHIDGSTNLQLKARNIVVQYVDTKVIDGEGRLDMQVIGSGKALIFNNGIVYEATWEKEDLKSPTRYLNPKGEEIKLMPGQSWVQIVPANGRVDF